ncbi:unnamed protein product [Cylicostephanus goldi]|uniref:Uncharacterized protein n=1 Tax=Cylicostephanus goldi TaxID=71465 RepID=A0A3P6QZ32_CYLGO|nr:unnamed protein product [Cylicostephanus goldi]
MFLTTDGNFQLPNAPFSASTVPIVTKPSSVEVDAKRSAGLFKVNEEILDEETSVVATGTGQGLNET